MTRPEDLEARFPNWEAELDEWCAGLILAEKEAARKRREQPRDTAAISALMAAAVARSNGERHTAKMLAMAAIPTCEDCGEVCEVLERLKAAPEPPPLDDSGRPIERSDSEENPWYLEPWIEFIYACESAESVLVELGIIERPERQSTDVEGGSVVYVHEPEQVDADDTIVAYDDEGGPITNFDLFTGSYSRPLEGTPLLCNELPPFDFKGDDDAWETHRLVELVRVRRRTSSKASRLKNDPQADQAASAGAAVP